MVQSHFHDVHLINEADKLLVSINNRSSQDVAVKQMIQERTWSHPPSTWNKKWSRDLLLFRQDRLALLYRVICVKSDHCFPGSYRSILRSRSNTIHGLANEFEQCRLKLAFKTSHFQMQENYFVLRLDRIKWVTVGTEGLQNERILNEITS